MEGNTQADIYDEEFFNNLQIAKTLISQIRRRKDKEICKKWIQKLCNLRSEDAVVKKNRNSFFKYMLLILHKGAKQEEKTPQFDNIKEQKEDHLHFMSKWSGDNRTYIAAKPLPGQGALIYMAVSSDPSLGWDHP
ncbi:uncharacterized protein [Leptinotarsa decemlineata]|uniref:uncharacterized protein n=1 Tax=Leptinotarsa decemlineata TaxID=7539 RepID=UPI000C254FAC|nr:uncharacterized protein LOC111505110 [Leptinotarsa decemlineata]